MSGTWESLDHAFMRPYPLSRDQGKRAVAQTAYTRMWQ